MDIAAVRCAGVSIKTCLTMRRWDWNVATSVSLSTHWLSLCNLVMKAYSLVCCSVSHTRYFF